MPAQPSASAIAEALRLVGWFRGQLIYRQVLAYRRHRLWQPTRWPGRWNRDFPALYTSLEERVAIAERVKLTLARPVTIVLARAKAKIRRVLDLTNPDVLDVLGTTRDALVTDVYDFTQDLAASLHKAGVRGLLVPAAIQGTVALYPRVEIIRRQHHEQVELSPYGTNCVLFPTNLTKTDRYDEEKRHAMRIAGIPAPS